MLFNEKLIAERANEFAARVLREVGEKPEAALNRAFWLALARPATSEERKLTLQYLDTQTAKGNFRTALADVCHSLFNINEFIYVD